MYGGFFIRITSDLTTETWKARYIQGTKEEEHVVKNTLSNKVVVQNVQRDKDFPGPKETERICIHQASPARNIKGRII